MALSLIMAITIYVYVRRIGNYHLTNQTFIIAALKNVFKQKKNKTKRNKTEHFTTSLIVAPSVPRALTTSFSFLSEFHYIRNVLGACALVCA